jgi:hypothetical protein
MLKNWHTPWLWSRPRLTQTSYPWGRCWWSDKALCVQRWRAGGPKSCPCGHSTTAGYRWVTVNNSFTYSATYQSCYLFDLCTLHQRSSVLYSIDVLCTHAPVCIFDWCTLHPCSSVNSRLMYSAPMRQCVYLTDVLCTHAPVCIFDSCTLHPYSSVYIWLMYSAPTLQCASRIMDRSLSFASSCSIARSNLRELKQG